MRATRAMVTIALLSLPAAGFATTRYVAITGVDSGACSSPAAACRTIPYGVSQMVGGDTLIVGNGTYTEPNAIREVPSGNPGPDGLPRTADDVYTTVRAATDFGVLIDGSGWPDTWVYGVRLYEKQFIEVRGFKIYSTQANENSGPISIGSSNHIKIIRNGFGYAGVTGNVPPRAPGRTPTTCSSRRTSRSAAARYMFLNYWADHTVFRRNVARNDYWIGTLQAAAFTNYDSVRTVWQNNIAIDSNTGCCPGHSGLYAAFFNENKEDHAPDTSQEFHGNIALNYKSIYGAHLDWVTSGTRHLSDNLWWDSNGGYCGEQGDGLVASWPLVTHITSGSHAGDYDPPNGGCMRGTGFAINNDLANSVTDSIFVDNESFGVAGYVNGNYDAYFGNGAPYGGVQPVPGPGDVTTHDILYSAGNPSGPPLPAARAGSRLPARDRGRERRTDRRAPAMEDRPRRHSLRRARMERREQPRERLRRAGGPTWPWPNEAVIKTEFAATAEAGCRARGGSPRRATGCTAVRAR